MAAGSRSLLPQPCTEVIETKTAVQLQRENWKLRPTSPPLPAGKTRGGVPQRRDGAAAGGSASVRMPSRPARSEPEAGALAAWAWPGRGVGFGGHLGYAGYGGVRGRSCRVGAGGRRKGERGGGRGGAGRGLSACLGCGSGSR